MYRLLFSTMMSCASIFVEFYPSYTQKLWMRAKAAYPG
jgi:hypothetical protein